MPTIAARGQRPFSHCFRPAGAHLPAMTTAGTIVRFAVGSRMKIPLTPTLLPSFTRESAERRMNSNVILWREQQNGGVI